LGYNVDLPIVIHTRESFDETFEVLERKNTQNYEEFSIVFLEI
jgi:Tat protein secretion system quality control protein TatD with DNase activity